ncbi:hypothetical protein AB0H83_29200 [Dactylosporangium sp. NPDC050688]
MPAKRRRRTRHDRATTLAVLTGVLSGAARAVTTWIIDRLTDGG